MGRPRKYATAQVLSKKIDEYFATGVALRKVVVGPSNNRRVVLMPVPTITGLVLYCGFCDRSSFYKLEEMPEFIHTIKKARTLIEQNYEEMLQTGLGAGAIFALKNFGWVDKSEVAVNGELRFTQMAVIRIEQKPMELDLGEDVSMPKNRIAGIAND